MVKRSNLKKCFNFLLKRAKNEKKEVGYLGVSFKERKNMPVWLSIAGKWGGIITIIALVITLLKQIIELIGFLMFAIKIVLFLGFIGLIVSIGYLAIRTWQQRRREV